MMDTVDITAADKECRDEQATFTSENQAVLPTNCRSGLIYKFEVTNTVSLVSRNEPVNTVNSFY